MRRDLGTGLRRGSQSGVSDLVFGSVYDGARRGVHWLYHEAGHSSPAEWARFQAGVPEAERDGDLVAAYNQVLNEHPDPAIRARAAKKVRLGGRHRFARGGVDPQSPLHEHGLPDLGPGHHISGSTEHSAGSTKAAPVE
jgi:hypothetical protein